LKFRAIILLVYFYILRLKCEWELKKNLNGNGISPKIALGNGIRTPLQDPLNRLFGKGILFLFLFLYEVPFAYQLKSIEKNYTI